MSILFSEMTRDEITEAAPQAVAVLPTAATEQHGPHMAVGTDVILCENVARRAAERAAERTPVIVAPILPFGSSWHHYPFGGTISLTSPTFITAVQEALEGLVRCGFRKIVVLNGHGGYRPARAARKKSAGFVSYSRSRRPLRNIHYDGPASGHGSERRLETGARCIR